MKKEMRVLGIDLAKRVFQEHVRDTCNFSPYGVCPEK